VSAQTRDLLAALQAELRPLRVEFGDPDPLR
jgi:hypothetical protein